MYVPGLWPKFLFNYFLYMGPSEEVFDAFMATHTVTQASVWVPSLSNNAIVLSGHKSSI